jgi:hypothetical protein
VTVANPDDQDDRFGRFVQRVLLVASVGFVFGILVFLFALAMPMRPDSRGIDPVGLIGVGFALFTLFLSTMMLLGSLIMRSAAMNGYRPWQFSLKSVLTVMTLFAVVLGCLVWVTRLM